MSANIESNEIVDKLRYLLETWEEQRDIDKNSNNLRKTLRGDKNGEIG